LFFTYSPKGLQKVRGPHGIPKRVPEYIAAVHREQDRLIVDWSGADDPGVDRAEIESEIAARLKDRAIWIDRVTSLVTQVELWAKAMNWSTRRVEKNLDDPWIGPHRVPALLLQEETYQGLLEPVGPSAPGAEGVVDLYILPAHEDVAVLFFYDGSWNLHYSWSQDMSTVGPAAEAEAMSLSKETLGKVLAEMKQHAS